jgi:hypothetical protein
MKRITPGPRAGTILRGASLGLGPCLGLLLACAAIAHAEPSASQQRQVGAFHAIDLAGTMEVVATVGKPASVEVTGDADLLDKVTTKVKDGVLVIDTPDLHDHHRRDNHLRVNVTAPDLDALVLSGTGAMKVAGIANERLAIDLGGTGALTASGSTGALHVAVGGTGEVAGKKLMAKDVVVDVGGTGSALLNASRSLDARISGTGSIRVSGHPSQVKKSVSGLGSIHID